MPGPAPQQNALRRDRPSDQNTWTTLPAEGRAGDPPTWPLSRANARESAQWTREWKRPQAVMWERDGQADEVAVYVRTLVRCDDREVGPGVLSALLRLQEALGLSQPGLARRRWKIEDVTVDARTTRTESKSSTRARLRAIEGGAA